MHWLVKGCNLITCTAMCASCVCVCVCVYVSMLACECLCVCVCGREEGFILFSFFHHSRWKRTVSDCCFDFGYVHAYVLHICMQVSYLLLGFEPPVLQTGPHQHLCHGCVLRSMCAVMYWLSSLCSLAEQQRPWSQMETTPHWEHRTPHQTHQGIGFVDWPEQGYMYIWEGLKCAFAYDWVIPVNPFWE